MIEHNMIPPPTTPRRCPVSLKVIWIVTGEDGRQCLYGLGEDDSIWWDQGKRRWQKCEILQGEPL